MQRCKTSMEELTAVPYPANLFINYAVLATSSAVSLLPVILLTYVMHYDILSSLWCCCMPEQVVIPICIWCLLPVAVPCPCDGHLHPVDTLFVCLVLDSLCCVGLGLSTSPVSCGVQCAKWDICEGWQVYPCLWRQRPFSAKHWLWTATQTIW